MKKAQSSKLKAQNYNGVIERYKKYLPVTDKTPVITLQEGNTPLIYSKYLSKIIGANFEVYL
ncbi:MAG: threonine synthase, partial [Candidatus Omnitrophica bacterium]|nr:threonine synthase [Candidatus Omnitrophota bacterium]